MVVAFLKLDVRLKSYGSFSRAQVKSNRLSMFWGAVYLAMLCFDSPELTMDLETESEEDSSQVGTDSHMLHVFAVMNCLL